MITRLWERQGRSKSSVAISVAIHAVVLTALATITFRYPLGEIFKQAEPVKMVAVRYIPLKPRQAASSAARTAPARATPPATPMPQVSSIPVGVPAPSAPVSPTPSSAAIGSGGSAGASGRDAGIGFGIRPGIPDGRLATNPGTVPRMPQTDAQKAERVLASIYQEYLDSARAGIARDSSQRKPGDWSWGGKDGDKWGWDQNGIHVGGITIPNIVLAALPLNVGPSQSPVDVRANDFVRADIRAHAGLMTQEEFKAAVRRVRERVDRERRERMEKEAKKKEPPCCS